MQATLTFALPEEQKDFEKAFRAIDYAAAVKEFECWLFAELDEVVAAPAERQLLDRIQSKYREMLFRQAWIPKE